MVTTMIVCVIGRVWFARSLVGMSVKYWLHSVALPLVLASVIAIVIGFIPQMLMQESFGRVVITTIMVEAVLLPMSWFFIMTEGERIFVMSALRRFCGAILNHERART